jgi:hypothetical protein
MADSFASSGTGTAGNTAVSPANAPGDHAACDAEMTRLRRRAEAAEAKLAAELDAAAAETEWGSRGPGPAAGVFRYGTDEFVARSVVAARGRRGIRDVLVRRTVTYGPWEDAGG